MASIENGPQPRERVTSLSGNIAYSKLQAGACYGAAFYFYRPATVADMELSSAQCLLLSLLHSLVTSDAMSCLLLADLSYHIQQLHSKHLKVWLMEDFVFPQQEMKKAMVLLDELITSGALKLPSHVMGIMSSLAIKYGINTVQFTSSLEDDGKHLAIELESAVIKDSPGDIISLVIKGGNVNGLTQSGDSLLHLAARNGSSASIAALGLLKADLEVVNSIGATPLEEALKNNDIPSVKALLKAGAKFDKHSSRGETYLHIAAAESLNGALEALLDAGIEVDRTNYLGETALVQAVIHSNVHGAEILLQKGADACKITEGGKSAFELALESQNEDLIMTFIRAAVKPVLRSGNSDTLLHTSVRSGIAEMVKVIKGQASDANISNEYDMLLEIGANTNFKTISGEGALHLAATKGSFELVRALIRRGAKVDALDDRDTTALMIASQKQRVDIVNLLLNSGANVNVKDENEMTPLHFASAGGCVACVTALLEAGALVDEKNNRGETALMISALFSKPDIVSVLLNNGADVDIKDKSFWTPLHFASAGGCLCCVIALLEAGAIVDKRNNSGETAAFIAIIKRNVSVLKLLIERGTDLTLKDLEGSGLIHCAAKIGCIEAVSVLLDAGVTVETNGWWLDYTAVHRAAQEGHTAMVSFLLDLGVDPGIKAASGWTPLIEASTNGSLDVVQLLIDRGAPLNEKCRYGHTALYYACAGGHTAVAEFLRANGGIE